MQQRLPHPDKSGHGCRPAGMVLVVMRQNQPIDSTYTKVPQIRHYDPFSDIKIILRPQRAAGIHQDGPPVRRDDQRRIALPHINEMHLQRTWPQDEPAQSCHHQHSCRTISKRMPTRLSPQIERTEAPFFRKTASPQQNRIIGRARGNPHRRQLQRPARQTAQQPVQFHRQPQQQTKPYKHEPGQRLQRSGQNRGEQPEQNHCLQQRRDQQIRK